MNTVLQYIISLHTVVHVSHGELCLKPSHINYTILFHVLLSAVLELTGVKADFSEWLEINSISVALPRMLSFHSYSTTDAMKS